MLNFLCAPALLFVAFSLTQIILDIFRTAYETALVKVVVMVVFTLVLNALCMQGLSVVSWMIVFIPFIMMTLITALILVMLGMKPDVDVHKRRPQSTGWKKRWWRYVKKQEDIDEAHHSNRSRSHNDREHGQARMSEQHENTRAGKNRDGRHNRGDRDGRHYREDREHRGRRDYGEHRGPRYDRNGG